MYVLQIKLYLICSQVLRETYYLILYILIRNIVGQYIFD